MSSYLIVNARVTDEELLQTYVAAAGRTLADHDVRVDVATNEAEALEDTPAGSRVIVLRFPDRDALMAWYQSEAYQSSSGCATRPPRASPSSPRVSTSPRRGATARR